MSDDSFWGEFLTAGGKEKYFLVSIKFSFCHIIGPAKYFENQSTHNFVCGQNEFLKIILH